ncbi:hypothetical protein RUM44_010839 [Polyplax serrata]|uniref:DMA domain-containing protein n=1 Tax=Polyplax serrata TaxID=468196 RepID=A0ABR1ANB4_POLSC
MTSNKDSKRARISVDDNDDDGDHDRENSDKQSRSSSPSAVHAMTPVTPMPLPLTTSSRTPSPEMARPTVEREEVDEVGESDRTSPLPENLSLPKKYASRPVASSLPYFSYHSYQQHHYQQQQRSPVDILIRAFPDRRRSEIEAVLQRCKGDVLQALEIMVCSNQSRGHHLDDASGILPKSAFSPFGPPQLGHQFHQRYSPQAHRRFLSAPYTGTGYLPTVIRPQSEYGLPMVGHHHDLFPTSGANTADKVIASSPGSGTGSDKTSYSE